MTDQQIVDHQIPDQHFGDQQNADRCTDQGFVDKEDKTITKLIIYKAVKRFGKLSNDQQHTLCEKLFQLSGSKTRRTVNEIFTNKNIQNKLLECLCKYCHDYGDEMFLTTLKQAIQDCQFAGDDITKNDIQNLKDRWKSAEEHLRADFPFSSPAEREELYREISQQCVLNSRYIVHFLNDISPSIADDIDTQHSEYLYKMLKKWDNKTDNEKRTWKRLGTILVFLNYNKFKKTDKLKKTVASES